MCACGPTTPSDSRDLVSADEGVNANEAGISGALAVGTDLRTTADLNFRSGPSTGYKVIRVLAKDTLVELVASQPSNGFYKVEQGCATCGRPAVPTRVFVAAGTELLERRRWQGRSFLCRSYGRHDHENSKPSQTGHHDECWGLPCICARSVRGG
jgi:hypothetical protein